MKQITLLGIKVAKEDPSTLTGGELVTAVINGVYIMNEIIQRVTHVVNKSTVKLSLYVALCCCTSYYGLKHVILWNLNLERRG